MSVVQLKKQHDLWSINKTMQSQSIYYCKYFLHLFIWNGNWSGNNEMKIVFRVVPEGIPLVDQMAVDCFWHLWEDVIHVITRWPRLFFYAFPLLVPFSTCFSTFWQWTFWGLLFWRQRCEIANRPAIINTNLRIISWFRMSFIRDLDYEHILLCRHAYPYGSKGFCITST